MRWRALPQEALLWRELEGQLVLRNAHTGNTHLLEPLAAEVLRTLMEAEDFLGVAEVSSRLQARFPGDNEAEWSTAIPEVLSELERLRLALPERDPA